MNICPVWYGAFDVHLRSKVTGFLWLDIAIKRVNPAMKDCHAEFNSNNFA